MRSSAHLSEGLLEQIAHLIDLSCTGRALHTAVFVEVWSAGPPDDEVTLGIRTFADHPIDALAGLVAPPSWWAFVLCTTGRAHFLDERDRPPEPIVSTFARSRDGHEVSLLRRGDEVTRLRGPAEGRVPDFVRAILGPVAATVPTDRADSSP